MNSNRQKGAVLFIALIMLLVLTVLAVSSMRGVTLESRIAGNRAYLEQAQHLADAALREAEFRTSVAPEHRSAILEPSGTNSHCKKSNILNRYGNSPPCVIERLTSEDDRTEYFIAPLTFLGAANGAASKAADDDALVSWMPYRGLDPDRAFTDGLGMEAYWHMYYIESDEPDPSNVLAGAGTHYFLANGQVNDDVAAQSFTALYFLN